MVAARRSFDDAGEAMGEAMGTIWGDEDVEQRASSEPGAATTPAMVCEDARDGRYADDEDGDRDDDPVIIILSGRVSHPPPHHPPQPPLSAVRDRCSSTAIAVVYVESTPSPPCKRKSKLIGECEVSSSELSPQRSSSDRGFHPDFHPDDDDDVAALCNSRKWTEDGDDVLEQLIESSNLKHFRMHEHFNELMLDEDTTDAAPMREADAADAPDGDGLVDAGVSAKRSDGEACLVLPGKTLVQACGPESLGAFCIKWELNKARSDDTSEHLKASLRIHAVWITRE
jgi:hypothetical protein